MATPKLESPDIHFLNSAIGWMELGDHEEAQQDLERISGPARDHPDVLIVQWKVHSRMKDWALSLSIARTLVENSRNKPTSWICLAYSLYNSDQTEAAWDYLLGAERRFPTISAIPYFLACLACQMGKSIEATKWLARWNDMVNESDLKRTARQDPRLTPAWKDFDEQFSGDGLRSAASKTQSEA